MLECQFCGCDDDDKEFQPDKNDKGFWCDNCDSFNYYEKSEERHTFRMLLEKKQQRNHGAGQKSSIRFNKRLSPLRYPGGKSKVIDQLYSRIQPHKSEVLLSPFTGGGSFEIALLDAGVVQKLHLNDLDTGIYSLWWMIVNMPNELIHRIQTVQPTKDDFFAARSIIKDDYKGCDLPEAAWTTLVNNRLAYSGVWKANPLGGKNGTEKALLSRWNPDDLCRRIKKISSLADRITVTQENAFEFIEEAYWNDRGTIFADPPYVEKGEQLYHTFFNKQQHLDLAFLLDTLHTGCPGADIILTYDYCEWIEKQYDWPEVEVFGRSFSV